MSKKKEEIFGPSPGETKVHPALQNFLGYSLYKNALRLRLKINEMLKDHDLIAAQLGVLTIIASTGPQSQIELGVELGIDKATMVKLLDGLEKNNFIEREIDKKDRRIKLIKITGKGKTFIKKMSLKRVEVEKQFLSVLSAKEQALFREFLIRLLTRSNH